MKTTLIGTVPVANTVGEGVTWDKRTGLVWWTDIPEKKLHRLHFESLDLTIFDLPERLGSFGLTDDPAIFICAFASGFYFYIPETGERTLIALVEADTPGTRLNDGRLDRQGRFWAGTMVEDPTGATADKGSLYSLDAGKVTRHTRGIGISNGMAWARDGKRLWHADTLQQTIWIYDVDADAGTIGNRQIFAATSGKRYPDGATLDREGCYWSAQWGSSEILRFAPDGSLADILQVNALQSACVDFGGPDMNILFVSTAREGLPAEALKAYPASGQLLIYETDVQGIDMDCYYSLG